MQQRPKVRTGFEMFYIKQNDTSPAFLYQTIPAVDLSGAAVVFTMRLRGGNASKINRAACSIVSPATAGAVRYDWQIGDTDVDGDYDAEFEVTYADGSVETFPNGGHISVKITGELG